MTFLGSATLLSLALMTGNEFCIAVFVEPVLRSLSDAEQVRVVPASAGRLGRWMPPWYALTLLLTAANVFLQYRRGGGWQSGAAISLTLQLVVLAVTLSLLVPRNTRLAKMKGEYPNWKEDARAWDRLHALRVILLLVATVALVAG